MTLLRAVHRLFLLITMLAIVVGPMSIGLAGSAMASSGAATMEDMSRSMPGMQMAENMPCCPDEKPVKPDCTKGCPLALVCTTSVFAHAPLLWLVVRRFLAVPPLRSDARVATDVDIPRASGPTSESLISSHS
ncbi:hypothetical protein ACOJBO_36990 [Rhizobium beringeri]